MSSLFSSLFWRALNIPTIYFFGGALYIYKKLSSFFHIILGSTGYFEKSPIPTILLWGALYIYEKLSSFTSLSCMIKVKKKLP